MGRRKGSKNKPKDVSVVKPSALLKKAVEKKEIVLDTMVEKAVKDSKPIPVVVSKKVEVLDMSSTVTGTKDSGVVVKAKKDTIPGAGNAHVVIRGGKAVKVEDTDDPDLY